MAFGIGSNWIVQRSRETNRLIPVTPSQLKAYKYASHHVVRVVGSVNEGVIQALPNTHTIQFTLSDDDSDIPVRYTGQLPSSFLNNPTVTVQGYFRKDGFFYADQVKIAQNTLSPALI